MKPAPLGLSIRNYGWRHPGRRHWALRDIDLDVAPGERVLLAGGSGAGKSTLLRSVAGLVDPADAAESTGDIQYRDGSRALGLDDAASRIGLMMQDPETNLILAGVGDDVAFGLENAALLSADIWPRARRALDVVGFPYGLDRPTAALSGGEKQRVALAGLLAREPGLVLLDEPTANLDPEGAALTTKALRDVLDSSGATLIVIEHRIEQVLDLVDRIVVLGPEGILADGRPGDVLNTRASLLSENGVFVPGWSTRVGTPLPTARPGPEVLVAEGLVARRVRNGPVVLHGISLSLGAGTATAIVGPNGAGKSTLARVLGGLLPPDSGAATAAGWAKPLHRLRSRSLAKAVGSVFQEPEHQFVARSVRAELSVGARAVGLSRARANECSRELLEELGLTPVANANPYTLSGGEKRRLAVGAALAGSPGVLVLDEPTFGQDAKTWKATVRLLSRQMGAERALAFVTHDEPLVRALGARTVRLSAGLIVGGGPQP